MFTTDYRRLGCYHDVVSGWVYYDTGWKFNFKLQTRIKVILLPSLVLYYDIMLFLIIIIIKSLHCAVFVLYYMYVYMSSC